MELTKELAQKVRDTVDAGLVRGMGKPVPGQMCVEAAVNYAMGLPHGDTPSCVGSAVRRFKIALNDSKAWTSDTARAKGLRRAAIAQLGSSEIDQVDFAKALALETIRQIVPIALRNAGIQSPPLSKDFETLAIACETSGDLDSAKKAAHAADAAAYAADAADAATDTATAAKGDNPDKILTLSAEIAEIGRAHV